jgi:hypothetical protein
MSRLIDAGALIAEMHNVILEDGEDRRTFYEVIERQPTIEPERWIPCSKTTDIPDHEIMACDEYGEIMFGYLAYEDDQWICASDGYEMVDPIAWREKPEPWREGGEQE